MADNYIFGSDFAQHGRGNLAGVRAGRRKMDILGTDLYRAALCRLDYRYKIDIRDAGDYLTAVGFPACKLCLYGVYKLDRLGRGLVHLPVSGYNGFS